MKAEENVQNLIENINDAVFSLDSQGRFIYLSPVIEQLISYRAEEMIGQPIARFVHLQDLSEFLYCLKRSLAYKLQSFDFRVLDKGGNVKHIRASVRPVIVGDQSAAMAGILSDITQWKWAEKQMRASSFRDRLTGLYNRAYFEEEMRRLDTPRQLPLSVVLADVNGLKLVNDVLGHSAGDQLLSKAAVILRECCRTEDVIARIGGDEFVVFLPRTSHQTTLKIVDRIKTACRNGDQHPIKLSLALGAVTKNEVPQDLRTQLKEAEDRMYQDKLMESKRFRTSVIASIRQALSKRKDETEGHILRLNQLTAQFGRHLGLPNHVLDQLALLSSLHDIGKIAIPETIGLGPNTLSTEEWMIMRKHPEVGYRIVASCPELAIVAEAILAHHEWWDGTGYPRGVKGEEIPLTSRMFSIADAYDEMTHGRPAGKAMSRKAVLDEIKKGAGNQFDPALVDPFIEVVSESSKG